MEEQEAIALLKEGDVTGLEILVSKNYFRAVKVAYLIIQDREDAEDIVQNAFLNAYEKIDQLASDRFGPWFLRSVINASIKLVNKQRRLLSLNGKNDDSPLFLEELLKDEQTLPESLVELDELSQVIWKALQKLTVEQRTAIVMKYYLEKSEREMCCELNQPLSTIKWRLYTARDRLRKLLYPYYFSIKPETSQPPEELWDQE